MIKRYEWDALKDAGICPECRQSDHSPMCRKKWFDYGFSVGYRDGANHHDRYEHAFLAEMIEAGEVDNEMGDDDQ